MWITRRAAAINVFQWTGSNTAALFAWAEANAPTLLPLTDNLDGTIKAAPPRDWLVLSVGDYLTPNNYFTEAEMLNYFEVPGPNRKFTTEA